MPTIEYAAEYLNAYEHSTRQSYEVSEEEVRRQDEKTRKLLDYLERIGVNTTPPKTRMQCPSFRPCPFVSCQYHLYLDVTRAGSIKINFDGIEPENLKPSCALDIVDRVDDGMTLTKVGSYMGLTRERIRQVQNSSIQKIRDNEEVEVEALHHDRNNKRGKNLP